MEEMHWEPPKRPSAMNPPCAHKSAADLEPKQSLCAALDQHTETFHRPADLFLPSLAMHLSMCTHTMHSVGVFAHIYPRGTLLTRHKAAFNSGRHMSTHLMHIYTLAPLIRKNVYYMFGCFYCTNAVV